MSSTQHFTSPVAAKKSLRLPTSIFSTDAFTTLRERTLTACSIEAAEGVTKRLSPRF
jgi:hypothetical protein